MNFTTPIGLISFLAILLGLLPPSVSTNKTASMPDVRNGLATSEIAAATPRRVALLFPLLSAYSTINQGLETLCCILKSDRSLALRGLLKDVFSSVGAISLAGDSFLTPDPEQVMSLHPDAVFIFKAFAKPLENVGLPNLIKVEFNPAQREKDNADIWHLVGYVSNKSARADALYNAYLSNARALQASVANLHLSPINVLPAVMTGALTWTVGGKGFQLNDIIQLAGGVNSARALSFQGNVDVEQLLKLDPEVIILLAWGLGQSNPKLLYDDPRLQSVHAIKDRRVYLTPIFSFFNQPLDEPLILSWMSELFHPTAYPRRTRQLYRKLYRDVLNYELSDAEIDQALLLEENSGSADYSRFMRSEIKPGGEDNEASDNN